MAYKVIILYRLYMPSYFLGTFTEYPELVGFFVSLDIPPISNLTGGINFRFFILPSNNILQIVYF